MSTHERLKKLRETLGLTRAEFAQQLSTTPSNITRWEQKTRIPRSRLVEICNVFGVNLKWLETGEGSMVDPNGTSTGEETIQDRFRQFRKRLGLTQQEIADQLGMTPTAVTHWEREGKIPQIKKELICQLYGINVNWLDTGDGEMFQATQETKEAPEVSSAREYAIRNGCGDITATIFERFMTLTAEQKKAFEAILNRMVSGNAPRLNEILNNRDESVTVTANSARDNNLFFSENITLHNRR